MTSRKRSTRRASTINGCPTRSTSNASPSRPTPAALLEPRGYKFTESAPGGHGRGILAGAPRLSPPGFGAAQSLNVGVPELPGAMLFGAHDPRGPAGAAVGD